MTVKEIMYFCIDDSIQKVEIWDTDIQDTIFFGYYSEIPKKYKEKEIGSWNTRIDGAICFNI